MRKEIEEDWTGFNTAVRHRQAAEPLWQPRRRDAQQQVPPLTSVPQVPPNRPVPPPPPQPPPPQVEPMAPIPPRSAPPRGGMGDHWKGLLVTIAIVLLLVLLVNLGAEKRQQPILETPPTITGNERVVTNYSTFHTVKHVAGHVVTGWKFPTSRADVPDFEFCYYKLSQGNSARRIFDIEERPSPGRYPLPTDPAVGLTASEWGDAFAKCQWHPSSKPVAQNTAPPVPLPPAPPSVPATAPAPAPAAAVTTPGASPLELLSPGQRELLRSN